MPRPADAATDTAERLFYGSMTEADLSRGLRRLALAFGYAHYHSFLSVRSTPGFVDVVLAKPGRLVLAELKRWDGRLSPAQVRWLRLLQDCPCEVYVWRPQDLPDVVRILETGATPAMRCVREVEALVAEGGQP